MPNAFADFFGLGIDMYPRWGPDETCRDLSYAASDCINVERALQEAGIISNSVVVTDLSEEIRPARGDVYRAMRTFIDAKSRDRPTIFYFAGHGTTINGEMKLCCSDFDDYIADKCGIAVSEIIEEIGNKSAWGIYVFDCCRAPLMGPETSGTIQRRGIPVHEKSLAVFSCSESEKSYEVDSIGGGGGAGVFSHFLCKAIGMHWGNKGARSSFGHVFTDAKTWTSDWVRVNGAKSQTPTTLGPPPEGFFLVPK